ncbi:MAG: helix-turn-helix transcriptional regulator [Treponema sp.]|uniref:helix-turn-helix domain-containing protein n=1 Tax=Treponema sp. TaxID=166 RepID=UPI0025CD74E7|nr:helix-turn-helix transcriptional regulator [Treponema sp.]MBQ9283304.1 helix-turn-helix transcriptional regulator [Treponema sp.]MBR1713795.1 helix-turn-helix transcriptional regulator [Treponema sp.]
MLEFWNNVKAELDYNLLSQKELAAKTEISYNTIQSWITKNRLPDAGDAVKIAKVLDVSVEYLVTGSESPKKQTNDEINSIMHDIKHLSASDLTIAKTVVHRLIVPNGK